MFLVSLCVGSCRCDFVPGLLEAGVARWDINRILQSIDVDDSGNVSYTEFLAACYSWQETELNVVWTAFQKIDKVMSLLCKRLRLLSPDYHHGRS